MQVKNLKYKYDAIDMEIDHPDYGWIPFTASPDDVEPLGVELYNKAINGDLGEIEPYVETPKSLDQLKSEKSFEIKNSFNIESNLPVSHNNISWVGGFDSATKLDSAVRLAESIGQTTVSLYDSNKTEHQLTLDEAKEIVKAVAIKYQLDFQKKQQLLKQIEEADEESISDIIW